MTPGLASRAASPPRAVRAALLSLGVLVVALLVVIALLTVRGGGDKSARASAPASPSASRPLTTADIYQRVARSVAVVRTARGALGSGVIAARDGTILTAAHVIADGSAITVGFADGTKSSATVASLDAKNDIATLTPATLPQPVVPATIGGSVEVGGDIEAIGNPLGLTFSFSAGVVSGVDRTTKTDRGQFSGLIQFDASVNPGSSGGPLLDAKADVIGIVTSIADPGGDDAFAGVAFAVPIGTALGGGKNGNGGGPEI